MRRIWTGCVLLSLLLTLASNPNRSLSFLVPDSFVPWVHVSPLQQWRHGRLARQVLAVIPPEASVAANTPLIPVLSHRQVLVRLPAWHQWQDSEGQLHNVDWVAIDTAQASERAKVFARDQRRQLQLELQLRDLQRQGYRQVASSDGVVVLRRS